MDHEIEERLIENLVVKLSQIMPTTEYGVLYGLACDTMGATPRRNELGEGSEDIQGFDAYEKPKSYSWDLRSSNFCAHRFDVPSEDLAVPNKAAYRKEIRNERAGIIKRIYQFVREFISVSKKSKQINGYDQLKGGMTK